MRALCLFRSSRREREKKELKHRRQRWFSLCPSAIVLIPILLFLLICAPMIRGADLGTALLMSASYTFVITMLIGLAVGWLSWRLCRRSDGMANFAFACIIAAGGFWTAGLNDAQRRHVASSAHHAFDKHVANVQAQTKDLSHILD